MSSLTCNLRSSSKDSKPLAAVIVSFFEILAIFLGRQVACVEEVVGLGQTKPEGKHQFFAVRMVAHTMFSKA